METKSYAINSFASGQCSGINEEKIPKDGVVVAQNCLIDVDGTFYKYGGKRLFITIGGSTEYAVNQVLFKKSDGTTRNIVVTYDTSISKQKVYFYSDALNEYVEITGFETYFGQNTLVRLLSYADVLWIIDGTYTYTWDGINLTRVDSGSSNPLLPSDFDGATLITQAHGIIYLSGYTLNPSQIAYSRYVNDSGYFILPTDSAAWDATNVLMLPQEGQIIKAVYGYRDMLFIWTEDKTWVLTGYVGSANTSLKPVYSIGCVSQESVRVVDNILYWCAKDGIYSFDGNQLKKLSVPIKNYFEDIATQFQNNIYNVYEDKKNQYEEYTTFVNCNYNDLENSIVPSTYPYIVDYSVNLLNASGLSSYNKNSIIQSFVTQSSYQGIYKLRVFVDRASKNTVFTVKIKDSLESETPLYSTTLDLSELPSYSPTEYGKGFAYATFDFTTPLDANTVYYIEIDNGNYISYCYSTKNRWDGDLWLYQNVQPSPIYYKYNGEERISMFLYPTESYFYTKVYNIAPISYLSKISCLFDETFLDDEVSLSLSSGYTLAYRFSTVSEADCLSKSWNVFNNNSLIKDINDILPVSSLYIQFKIIMKNKNIYQDQTEWFMQKMLCKFDGIKFYANSNGYSRDRKYFANSYNDKYMISIPEVGKTYNQKIFVLNNGSAWTYFDINTDCFWQYKEDLFFADNLNNNIYYLEKTSSLPITSLDTLTELGGYTEISDMETKTIGAVDYLAEKLNTGDPLNVSDNFEDGVLDSKWILWGSSGVYEDGGYLKFDGESVPYIYKYGGIYQEEIKSFKDLTVTIDYIGGLKYSSDFGGDRLDFVLGEDNDASGANEHITVIIEKKYTDYDVYIRQYDKSGNYVNGVTITGVVPQKIKHERITSTNTVNVYYYDGASWILAYSNTCFEDVYSFYYEIIAHFLSGIQSTFICDNFTFIGDYYSPTGYAIYEYDGESNSNLQLFYNVPQIYSDQTVSIYCATMQLPDFKNEYDRYVWVKLVDITQDNNVGNVYFTTPNNSIRRLLITYSDGGSSGDTLLLDYIRLYIDYNFKTIVELPYVEIGEPDKEKYLRKCYIGLETDGNYGLYYKTEKMDGWHYTERSPDETRISLKDEHGKKIKFKIVSENSVDFVLKHFTIYYKERGYR